MAKRGLVFFLTSAAFLLVIVNATNAIIDANSSARDSNSIGANASHQVLLFQRHLSNPKCCYGHCGHAGSCRKKIEKGLAWTCDGCNCKNLADRETTWSTSHCNRHSWTEFRAAKICVRRFNRNVDPNGHGFMAKTWVTLWDGGREIIPFTDWNALSTNSGRCIQPWEFHEAVPGDRLKIELRAAKPHDPYLVSEGWGGKRVKKSTRSVRGSFVYDPDAGEKILTCYPNYGHVKHPNNCVVSSR